MVIGPVLREICKCWKGRGSTSLARPAPGEGGPGLGQSALGEAVVGESGWKGLIALGPQFPTCG